jgi:hypothetical protein
MFPAFRVMPTLFKFLATGRAEEAPILFESLPALAENNYDAIVFDEADL